MSAPLTQARLDELRNTFEFRSPDERARCASTMLGDAALNLAIAICGFTPEGREQDAALEHVRDALLLARDAIARQPA